MITNKQKDLKVWFYLFLTWHQYKASQQKQKEMTLKFPNLRVSGWLCNIDKLYSKKIININLFKDIMLNCSSILTIQA